MTWAAFIAGAFLGVFFGVMVMAIVYMSRGADK